MWPFASWFKESAFAPFRAFAPARVKRTVTRMGSRLSPASSAPCTRVLWSGTSKLTPDMNSSTTAAPCASGMAVLDMRWAIEKMLGPSMLEAALEKVSPAARDEYLQATALSWVTYTTLAEVHDSLSSVAKMKPMTLADNLARLTVERSFTTVWRIFLRFTSDEAIIVRTPAFYAKSRSVGYMASRILAPGKSESIVSGFPAIPERDIVILAASIETVIALAGRQEVRSRGERTSDGARFLTTWRV
jgi:hypothetical protein